jgi:hypothetical protein
MYFELLHCTTATFLVLKKLQTIEKKFQYNDKKKKSGDEYSDSSDSEPKMFLTKIPENTNYFLPVLAYGMLD